MHAARNTRRHAETAVRPLLEAAVDLAMAGIPVLPSHYPVPAGLTDEGWPRLGCSCSRDDCLTPTRHLMAEMEPADASTDPVRVAQWWTGGMREANVAAVTGQAFDVVELRHPGRPEDIRAWLADFQVVPGPVLDAGIGRVQFLTVVGETAPCFAPIGSTGGVRRLRHGAIVLLPPSRLVDWHEVAWLQGLHGVTLPDVDRLFEALARLPEAQDLTAWARRARAEQRPPSKERAQAQPGSDAVNSSRPPSAPARRETRRLRCRVGARAGPPMRHRVRALLIRRHLSAARPPQFEESPMPSTPSLVRSALSYPTRGLAVLPCHWPAPPNLPQFCSCGDLECPQPARHPIGTLTTADATRDLGQLSRWWLAHPIANVGFTTDETRVGVLELHHGAPADDVLRLLNESLVDPGPVILAGPGRLQFLVTPDDTSPDHPATNIEEDPSDPALPDAAQATCLEPGTVVLLPPSRLMDGERLRWLRRLVTTTRLPDVGPLLDTLVRLADSGALDDDQR
ncbi:MAG TPA: bifunctional DNA primase/polymerase [Actinomycetes bacterium]|jgi:hypothetical protein|nr:bifunctional DNA primase/polymerase [Actinomycetes bacterium]